MTENTRKSASEEIVVPQDWMNAREYASALGTIPSSFSTAIRLLVADDAKNGGTIQPVSKYQVARILNTPSFKSMLYHAARELRESQLKAEQHVSIGFLINCFGPLDLAALISCFVYFRKCRKILDSQHWTHIEYMISRESITGAHMGTAIPRIGTGAGLLLGTARYFGLSAIAMREPQAFKEYRRLLKNDHKLHDEEVEIRRFGCTATEVAVFLLSSMGFGVEIGSAFARAYDRSASLKDATDDLHFRMQIGRVWIESLLRGLKQPDCPIPGHYYPLAEDFETLQAKLSIAPAAEEHFLARTKDDISPETTPALFMKPEREREVPTEIAHIFDYQEIAKMEEEDFDRLIDYMDEENGGKVRPCTVTMKDVSELEKMVE